MKKTSQSHIVAACVSVLMLVAPQRSKAAPQIIDDFNVNSGHFTSTVVGGSGSTTGLTTGSGATRITTDSPVEGAGHQRITLAATNSVRLRHLSGGGSPGANTVIATTAGTDGWLGVYIKTFATNDPNWTVQIWLEGGGVGLPQASTNNGSVPKTIIADGAWHLYEWNLDDFTGGPDSWGLVPNIIAGSATILDGNHTIDSIIFRNSTFTSVTPPITNIFYMDFVARNDAGSVADLLSDPCNNTSSVGISGPVSTNSSQVIVSGVSASATNVTVYQNTGPGGSMVQIGTKTSGVTAGDNAVNVSGLVKGALVSGTQKINGQEGCVITAGNNTVLVGGGANPSVRMALSIRETSSTGPVGSPGDSSSQNIHFLNATVSSSGAPVNADVVYPSNGWQTITFIRGTNEVVGDSANAAGATSDAAAYQLTDTVSVQAYAYRTLPNGTTIYSVNPATSADVTSNDVFAVNWTWNAVPGAQGYRLLRNLNGSGYNEYVDVGVNNYADLNTGWTPGNVVSPTTAQSGRSVKWNRDSGDPVGTTNSVPGQWGIFESIGIAIHNLDDTGPFDLYIDNLQNGATVFQTFEDAPAKTSDYGFRAPSFSGTTGGNILASPDVTQISNQVADGGTKSIRVRFQWKGTNSTTWLRLTTSGVNNPQVNLDEPISFRLLFQPVSATLPTPPTAPSLSVGQTGDKTVLNWTGGHRLQTSVDVSGTYTNVPQNLNNNVWTNITQGAFLSPWTNNFTEPNRFFRLVD